MTVQGGGVAGINLCRPFLLLPRAIRQPDQQLICSHRKPNAHHPRLVFGQMQTGEYQMYFWPLRKEREARTRQEFPIWKTITLGMCKSPDEYRKALKQARISIGDWGNDILDRTACSQEEIEVDLVVLSVSELGFYRSAKYKDLCAKALELGLQLCPAEVGPALRLSYKDQPVGERLRIAMKAITSYGPYDGIFEVVHEVELEYDEDELWLGGNCGVPDIRRRIRSRFVFVRPKPISVMNLSVFLMSQSLSSPRARSSPV
jgi:hypothetical protein